MNVSPFSHMRPARAFGAAIVFCLAWTSAIQAQSTVPNPLQGLREFLGSAIRVQQRHSQRLLADSDIVGTGVGLTANGEPAIKVFTKSEAIMRIPRSLDGLPVEVESTGEFHSAARLREAAPGKEIRAPRNPARLFPRPVPIGVSIGNQGECSTGTIGARVIDSDGNVYALSNNHVLALENSAAANSKIVQPGLANVKRCLFAAENAIGTLSYYAPIVFSRSANNRVDAAIAASDVSLLGNATPAKGYGTPDSTLVSAFVGQPVQKYGEKTRLTQGRVKAINATVLVEYDSGAARFINQILVESRRPFIKAGDSGALLVTNPGVNPVGLLFAGAKGGRIAIANPIDLVLNAFGVSVDGQ